MKADDLAGIEVDMKVRFAYTGSDRQEEYLKPAIGYGIVRAVRVPELHVEVQAEHVEQGVRADGSRTSHEYTTYWSLRAEHRVTFEPFDGWDDWTGPTILFKNERTVSGC